MKKFKEVMKRIAELIKSFSNPVLPEKSFDELAVAAGIQDNEISALKASMEGISWSKFAREEEKAKRSRTILKNTEVSEVQAKRNTRKTEIERDRD